MLIEQLLPEVKKLISDKIVDILKEKGPKVAFANIYNMLPFYIRAIIKEDAFIKFCISHQDKIFGLTVKQASKKVGVKKPKKSIVKKNDLSIIFNPMLPSRL